MYKVDMHKDRTMSEEYAHLMTEAGTRVKYLQVMDLERLLEIAESKQGYETIPFSHLAGIVYF